MKNNINTTRAPNISCYLSANLLRIVNINIRDNFVYLVLYDRGIKNVIE
jgi:hypothetical protein